MKYIDALLRKGEHLSCVKTQCNMKRFELSVAATEGSRRGVASRRKDGGRSSLTEDASPCDPESRRSPRAEKPRVAETYRPFQKSAALCERA